MSDMDTWWEAMIDGLFEGVLFVDRERRVLLWNHAAERITGHAADSVLNRRCSDAAICHVDASGASLCLAGCPLARVMSDGGSSETEAWVLHRDGHRLSVRIHTSAVLDRAGKVVGAVEVFEPIALGGNAHASTIAPVTVLTDPLTGTAADRVLTAALESKLRQTAHEGLPFGVCILWIDRLSWVRATYGDGAGLELVRLVARTLAANVGVDEIVSRKVDDTLVVLVSAADAGELHTRADRFRMLVERSVLSLGAETAISTVSVGATVSEAADTIDSLLSRAHVMMEHSRRQGGGCITVSPVQGLRR